MYKQQNYFQERYIHVCIGDSISSQSLKNLTIFNFAQTYANHTPERNTSSCANFFRRIGQVFFEVWSRHVIFVRFDLLNVTITSDVFLLAKFLLINWYFCTPLGWISRLQKIPRHSNLHTTYLSRYLMRWYSQTNIFQPEVFFSNLQMSKYTFF